MAALTKSRYLSGLQCLKRLWIDEHAPERLTSASLGEQRIIQQGMEVGQWARELFPEGILVESLDFRDAAKKTHELIHGGAGCIFEAAFQDGGLRVRCDVLVRQGDNSWKVVEVKSSTNVKEVQLPDLAFQYHVLSKIGIPVEGLKIMHINSGCVYPDLSDLFSFEDVTSQVLALQEETARNADTFITTLNQDSEPGIKIGRHCIKPGLCPAKETCWAGVPDYSIFTIPRLSEEKISNLVSSNCISLNDLPVDYPLSEKQRAYVKGVLDGEVKIDRKAVREVISGYEYPIHFLDFETLDPAVPRFAGMRPYQQFPFQYSLHILYENGTLKQFEYLHMDKTDPRLPLLESLLGRFADHGAVVVYNAPFERGVLASLAEFLPRYASALNSITDRLKDQMDIFKYHYSHPGFLGKISLKNVLPVIVPSLSYESLNVSGGSDAQAVWDTMIRSTDMEEQKRMAEDLKAYCALDTLAMVEIHSTLLEL